MTTIEPATSVTSDLPSGASPERRSLASISCVVPCLNEHDNLSILLPELMDVLRKLACAYEIIIVDDGSTDATATLLQHWTNLHPQIVYLRLARNFGKENALTAGLKAAKGQVVVCLDADGQHPPELISRMIRTWSDGADMVYGVRANRKDETTIKRWGTRLFYSLMRTSDGLQVPADAGDFRLMDRVVVDALLTLPERDRFMKGLFAWVGFDARPLLYEPLQRMHGKSSFRISKLFKFAVGGLTAFTTWPLRLLSIAGLSLAALSFAYGLFIILKYWLYGDAVRGWSTLITVVLFFAGINLLSMGILGEYIARIFTEVKQRPIYLLRERRGKGLKQMDGDSMVARFPAGARTRSGVTAEGPEARHDIGDDGHTH
ncbi:glycosyltransferase family 2 protein [Pusillimonas sp. ANT_WB101]|uniref:glycosyltransferase family 2 protein n=1 Tax=Pusillimonas sp. ANT_WB101 TaxID=2597356 RepID=UPI00210440BE|nr:glycosyltransferase family 2 protein [Pusillimonas sp. ANT_WB101]